MDKPIELGASFGISLSKEYGNNAEELIKIADENMYKEKSER